MGRIRICHLITELRLARAERSVYDLSSRLDRGRFDVRVAALRGGEVADWLKAAGIPVTVLGMRGKWDVLKVSRLVGLLRAERIDLLHTHLFHADLVGRLAASMAAVPHLVHTVQTAEGRFRPWHFAFARLFSDRCERIICVSRSVCEHHAERSGLPRRCYQVITNGIAAESFARDEQSRRRLRAEWGIEPDQPLAVFVGRLAPEKGVEALLAAMSHLAARGDTVALVVAGDGPRRRVVDNFIAHGEGGKHCRAIGFVRDVRGVLSAADMLILPSRWEGCPMAAGEAMAAGLPVVGTEVAGVRDLVQDGRTGLLVPPDNVVALAEAIRCLAGDRDLCRQLGRAGRERIIRDFSIEATVAAHEKLYLQIVGKGGSVD